MNENIQTLKLARRINFAEPFKTFYARIQLWRERQRGRRQLAEIPSYLLRDIGISESDRYEEINKPFWKD